MWWCFFKAEIKAVLRQRNGLGDEDETGGDLGDEDDLVMTQTTGDTIDPITKRQMTDPVKNTFCGHSYERASVLAMITRNKIKCPIAGCPNDTYIEKSHLIDDMGLKRKIERMNKSRR